MLASAELNAAGGLFGKPIELIVADPGWTAREASEASGHLVDVDEVDAVIGMHPSNIRQAVKRRLRGEIPYIYTPQYEGGETAAGTVAIGGTDAELLRPILPWFTETRRAKRLCLLANDYVWPRRAVETSRRIAQSSGATILAELVVDFGTEDYAPVLDEIRRLRPDLVVMFLLGEEMVRFNRAFAAAGLAAGILRLGFGLDVNVLYGIGADAAENLYSATTWTPAFRSRSGGRLLELYHDGFGEGAPAVSVFGQSCYEGVHLAARLALEAGRAHPAALVRALAKRARRCDLRALLPETMFAPQQPILLARAEGLDFEIVVSF
jgi:ABC-type branched-subunit amino acid transport system substrate-binding protein